MIKQMKARAEHLCHVCGRDILPGCEYIQEKNYNGRVHCTLNRHIHCDAVISAAETAFGSGTAENIVNNICELNCSRYDECSRENIYACDIIHGMLLSPVMHSAARQSVKDNGGANGKY